MTSDRHPSSDWQNHWQNPRHAAIENCTVSQTIDATNAAAATLARLEAWGPIAALKSSLYAYPLLEVVHLIALATLFGTIFVVDMRILGRMRALDLAPLTRTLLPWTVAGFALALLTGLTMFVMRISDLIANPMFIAKMCLLFAAGANAGVLHARGPIDENSAITRGQAFLSILIWVAVIFCGRWIAYI
jgi:hypothetical protein